MPRKTWIFGVVRCYPSSVGSFTIALVVVAFAALAFAQETDVTQTPNAANAGIKKSLEEQIGAGRGDTETPDSSRFIIARDPLRAVARGRQLFQRKFTLAQGLGPRTGDGIGDIETDASHGAGLADSCAACHGRPQGSAGFGGDVFTRPASRDAPHLFGLGLQEMLADEITGDLRAQRDEAIAAATATGDAQAIELESKGISYGTLIVQPDGSVDTSAVVGIDADLRVRPFFAEGTTFSIREFVVGAFNAEMGLESPDPDMVEAIAGADVVTPSGMVLSGSVDTIEAPPVDSPTEDSDEDGVSDEIPPSLVDFVEFYLLNYFRPAVRGELIERIRRPRRHQHHDDDDDDDDDDEEEDDDDDDDDDEYRPIAGVRLFHRIGCADCHVQTLTIDNDRRIADVSVALDPEQGNPFNQLFATAIGLFEEIEDNSGFPTIKSPAGESFVVENIFTDFKRHDLGPNFWEKNFDGTIQKEFMTEPLWGVGSTGPFGHDGRSPTLRDVILRHGGEAQAARDEFAQLTERQRRKIESFLDQLVLFSPPSTASTLNPIDPGAEDYPVNGHGSIELSVLFNDPDEPE